MCPVRFIILTICVALGDSADLVGMTDLLREVAAGKPLMVSGRQGPDSDLANETIRTNDLGADHSTNRCSKFSRDQPSNQVTLDLLEHFPVSKVKLIARSYIVSNKVTIYVDNVPCTSAQQVKKSTIIQCHLYVTGRTVRAEFTKPTPVCVFDVYTCKEGLRGMRCDEACSDGKYGVGCSRYCQCNEKNEICDKADGHCKSGCHDSHRDQDCFIHLLGATRLTSKYVTSQDIIRVAYSSSDGKRVAYTVNENRSGWKIDTIEKRQYCYLQSPSRLSESIFMEVHSMHTEVIYGFEVVLDSSEKIALATIAVTVNNHYCSVSQVKNLGPRGHRLKQECTSGPLIGRLLRVTIIADFQKEPNIRVCSLSPLVCAFGVFGPRCQLPCQCVSGPCEPRTGQCARHTCRPGMSGKNCATVDLVHEHLATVYGYKTWTRRQPRPKRFSPLKKAWRGIAPNAYETKVKGQWVSWLALRLDSVYHVKKITLVPNSHQLKNFRHVEVFLESLPVHRDPLFKVHKHLDRSGRLGLPCRPAGAPGKVVDVPCRGPARTVTVAVRGNSKFVSAELEEVAIWTCMDGTYGEWCENICNCQHVDDVCDKATGQCPRGCAHDYVGPDCQEQCSPGSPYPSCTTKKADCQCVDPEECLDTPLVCPSGCVPGYWGVACLMVCREGYFGPGCALRCDQCPLSAMSLNESDDSCNPLMMECPFKPAEIREMPELSRVSEVGDDREKIYVVLAVVLGAILLAVVTFCICALCRRVNNPSKHLEKSLDLRVKRLLCRRVSENLIKENREKEEKRVKRDAVKRIKQKSHFGSADVDGEGEALKYYDQTLRKTLMELKLEAQPNILAVHYPGTDKDGRCAPLEDNTQLNAKTKVAEWIVEQDFEELISRRIKRLENYQGDILTIQESSYDIEVIPLSAEDIHRLYDEVGLLALP